MSELNEPLPKRQTVSALIFIALFLAMSAFAIYMDSGLRTESFWRYLLASLPAIVFGAWVASYWRAHLRRLDEMRRQITLEAALSGYLTMLVLCVGAHILETLGGIPRVSPILIMFVGSVGYVISWLLANRRYE